jgi:(2Fe-2S) ferredoxin
MEFCSTHSRDIGEPLPGLGHLPPRVLAVARPKSLWGPTVATGKGLPEELRLALEAAEGSAEVRVQLVHRRGAPVDPGRFDMDLFPGRAAWRGLDAAGAAAVVRALAEGREPPPGVEAARPKAVVLCCTDAKVDACCARLGHRTYRALAAAAARRGGDVEIWETSHVGGCRLAANCIVLPHRARYARVDLADAERFLDVVAEGGVALPQYRGDPDLDELGQVAHAAALAWAAGLGAPPVAEVLERVETGPGRATVAVAVGGGAAARRLSVACALEEFLIYGSCEDRRDGVTVPFPRWVATDVREAGAPLDRAGAR